MSTRTYLSTPDGFGLTSNPDIVLPYQGNPPPPTNRFFGDPGAGNMYAGVSDIIAGRETYFGQRVGVHRFFSNIGIVQTNNSSGWQSARDQAVTDIHTGRVPWASFKLKTNQNAADKSHDVNWAQAAAGNVDDRIVEICSSIVAGTGGRGPVFITWHHEPNGDTSEGTAAQYLAMNRHMQSIMEDYPSLVHVGALLSAGFYQMNGGGYNVVDWMRSDSCDIFGLDMYNQWSPVNGKDWWTVDQDFRQGGIAECLALDSSKPIAIGEFGCRTRPTSGESAQWMQDAYDYCRNSNVVSMAYFDSGVGAPDGPWILDKNYLSATESPAPRLIKWKEILLKPTSKLITPGGLIS